MREQLPEEVFKYMSPVATDVGGTARDRLRFATPLACVARQVQIHIPALVVLVDPQKVAYVARWGQSADVQDSLQTFRAQHSYLGCMHCFKPRTFTPTSPLLLRFKQAASSTVTVCTRAPQRVSLLSLDAWADLHWPEGRSSCRAGRCSLLANVRRGDQLSLPAR